MKSRILVRDLTYGALGGIVGTVVMEQVATLLYRLEDEQKKKREEELRREPPYQTMARRIAERLVERPVSEETISMLGTALHWGYGAAWGALYGLVHDRVPVLSHAGGLPFGVLFTLIGDEALNTGLKLTPPPQAFPIEAHLRGLAAHLVYTLTADTVIHLLRGVAEER